MIQGVRELGETTVKEVMVPRIDTVFLAMDSERGELLEKVVSCGHSRIPVYGDTIDSVVGVLYAKDLLRVLVKGGDFSLADLVRKPFFVPESKRIDSLLKEFRRRRVHIAVVVDEYGGVSGIVCLEDIIEEIVGEIQDEFDEEREDVVRLGDSSWLCDARADLDDVNRETGLALPADDFDTLGRLRIRPLRQDTRALRARERGRPGLHRPGHGWASHNVREDYPPPERGGGGIRIVHRGRTTLFRLLLSCAVALPSPPPALARRPLERATATGSRDARRPSTPGASSRTRSSSASPRTGIPRSTTTSPRSPRIPPTAPPTRASPSATTSSASTTRPSPTSARPRPSSRATRAWPTSRASCASA